MGDVIDLQQRLDGGGSRAVVRDMFIQDGHDADLVERLIERRSYYFDEVQNVIEFGVQASYSADEVSPEVASRVAEGTMQALAPKLADMRMVMYELLYEIIRSDLKRAEKLAAQD